MSDLHGANDGTRIQILIDGEWCESVYNYCMMKPHYPVPTIFYPGVGDCLFCQVYFARHMLGLDYTMGLIEPNYPVPAVRCDVHFGSDWISTVDTNGSGYSWNNPVLTSDNHFYQGI